MYLKKVLVLLLVSVSINSFAGSFACDSQATGNWSDASTWINCNSTIPQNGDSVTIKNGHTVTLDVNSNELQEISVEVGGDFDVAFDAAGLTLFGNNVLQPGLDLRNASIDLFGDFTIDAPSKDIKLGSIDGAFGLTLNSTKSNEFHGIIGGTTPLTSLTTDADGFTFFYDSSGGVNDANIIVNGPRIFNDQVRLNEIANISGSGGPISFSSTVNSNSNHALIFSSVGDSTITFNGDVGVTDPLGEFRIFNSIDSTVELNLAQFNTVGLQSWDTNILLNSPTNEVSLNSSNGSTISIGSGSYTVRSENDGEDALTINTAGTATLNAVIGDNSQQLSNLTLNSSASATINSNTITVMGTQSYAGPVELGNDTVLSASIVDIQSTVDNGGFDLTINTTNETLLTKVDGAVSGSGNLIKQGEGKLVLGANNSYTGITQIMAGKINLADTTNSNPIASSSVIEIRDGAFLDLINDTLFVVASTQTLAGSGELQTNLEASSGAFISPGLNGNTGILNVGNAQFNSGSQINIDIEGNMVGTDYDQLSVSGDMQAGGATLNLTVSNITAGDTFIIVANDGVDVITGTFDLLAEGANLVVGNYIFTISYAGGDGNDIELTETSCQTVQDGLWSEDTTWANCDGPIPQSTDDVSILHAVSFDVGAIIQSIDFGPSGDFDVAASGAGLSLDITGALADFSLIDIELFGDFTLTNTNNKIYLGAIDGKFNLVLNSDQQVFMFGNHTSTQGLKSIVTDAGGSTRIANGRTFVLTGDVDTVFNDNVVIGASARVILNQTGVGNITFNGNISKTSGGPHKLTLSNDVGETQVNGTVLVGDLITNGTAVFRISGGAITTTDDGANNGDIIFNSPVVVTIDTVFSSSGSGEIFFNNTLNDDGIGATSSVVTINNPNNTVLSYIGISNPIDSLTTDATGTTTVNADIDTLISTVFNDDVVLGQNIELSGVIVDMKGDVDNAGFDLTFDTSNNNGLTGIDGVLSGSGDFVSNGNGAILFSSVNTLTGHMIFNDGSIENRLDTDNIFPAVPVISIGNGAGADIGSFATGIFRQVNNQMLIGTGDCGCLLIAESGSMVSPGFSPGQLSIDEITLNTGSALEVELNGTTAGSQYDQVITASVNLDGNGDGGANLSLTLGYVPNINDSFMIINNIGVFPVTGTFKGLSEGGQISIDDNLFGVTYVGGDGNDVVLTALGSSILYVNENVAVAGNGSSWTNAFDNLQDALAVASMGMDIWVAQGVYYPDVGMGQVDNNPSSTFKLVNGVSLYGGFDATEVNFSERDSSANITLLSGDIDGDDLNVDGNNIAESVSDIQGLNAYHILDGFVAGINTIIDGFVITAGSATQPPVTTRGGGLICNSTIGPLINNITFIGNLAIGNGGAISECINTISNSQFLSNQSLSGSGGAIFANGGDFSNVVFEGNQSNFDGGALSIGTQVTSIKQTIFQNNNSSNGNGGALATSSGDLLINDVLFLGNHAGVDGGAIYIDDSMAVVFTNITATGNNATVLGGGIRTEGTGSFDIRNSIIWNNQDSTGSTTDSSAISSSNTVNNSYSLIQGFGIAGTSNLDEDPEFITIANPSTAPNVIGNPRLQSTSMAIDTGDNSIVTSTIDLNNRDRVVNGTVDRGAYEFFEELVFADGFE